jgi:transposase
MEFFLYITSPMAKELLTKTEHKQKIHQIVWQLHQQGLNQEQIGEAVGYTQANISLILQTIQEVGIENYEVGVPPGAPTKLSEPEFERLRELLLKEAEQNGFATDGWTQKRVQALIKKEFGVHYARAYISEILAKLDFTLQLPRLRDIRQDEERRQEYREETLPELKKNPLKPGTP